jgi:hypothetical protein
VSARAWLPIGFVVLMVGFGLDLDSDWQRLGGALLIAGAAAVAIGLRPRNRARAAFVPPPGRG